MTVDSRDKRFSIMGLSQPVPSVFSNPDGTVGTQDRAQWVFLYHGLALDAPAVASHLWLEGAISIIPGLDGAATVSPSLDGSITINTRWS